MRLLNDLILKFLFGDNLGGVVGSIVVNGVVLLETYCDVNLVLVAVIGTIIRLLPHLNSFDGMWRVFK